MAIRKKKIDSIFNDDFLSIIEESQPEELENQQEKLVFVPDHAEPRDQRITILVSRTMRRTLFEMARDQKKTMSEIVLEALEKITRE